MQWKELSALARSNADLLIGPSETEGSAGPLPFSCCRSKYAARRASRWLRKVTPPYFRVMPWGDGVHL